MQFINVNDFLRAPAKVMAYLLDKEIHLVMPDDGISFLVKSEHDVNLLVVDPDGQLTEADAKQGYSWTVKIRSPRILNFKKSNLLAGGPWVRHQLRSHDIIRIYRHSTLESHIVKVKYTPDLYVPENQLKVSVIKEI